MDAVLKLLSVDVLDDHPKNPRVVMREDVIDSITTQIMESGYKQQYAIHVRPIDERFEIIGGHHRKRAAIKAGLTDIWCWVEHLGDEAAFMALVTSNSQGELDPLEIGIHAFEAVPEGKRGRGNKGDGIQAYADKIGQKRQNVSSYRMAGEVAKFAYQYANLSRLLGKALHLAAIHDLPQTCWREASKWIVDSHASVQEAVDRVKECVEFQSDIPFFVEWFPPPDVASKVLSTKDFSAASIKNMAYAASSLFAEFDDTCKELIEEFKDWAIANKCGDSWNNRQVLKKLAEIKNKTEMRKSKASEQWIHGDWRTAIQKIENSTVSLVLTDPPYGLGYVSNRKAEKHKAIANDDELGSAVDELRDFLQQIKPKLKSDSHLLVFCRWDSEPSFQACLRTSGFTLKGSVVWVKDNHGTGYLKGSFAPKHERIVHAVLGSPSIHDRKPDVLECPKSAATDHPTEKPVDLLKMLIEATTVSGDLVIDPFGGVGSTCVAASQCGRGWFGSEMEESYHKIGLKRLGGSNG